MAGTPNPQYFDGTLYYTDSKGQNQLAAGAVVYWSGVQGACTVAFGCNCPTGENWEQNKWNGTSVANSAGFFQIPIYYCCGPVTLTANIVFKGNSYTFLWNNLQSGCGVITGDIEAEFLLCGGQAQAFGANSTTTCQQCTSNSNCPSGYICVDSVCQLEQTTPGAGPPPPPFDYAPLIAVAIIVGIVIVIALVVMKKI